MGWDDAEQKEGARREEVGNVCPVSQAVTDTKVMFEQRLGHIWMTQRANAVGLKDSGR
ncbi:hypothetical protein CDL15_Pgr004779 [Punica granatum]|uniref:Uncharacterized protein n=1 Tax=Punica granatum TaxID=22663 RepID=A0A218W5Z7_PUNGR|nr:hypothetical protein CDL15_Pgr004779 [Punica granatum]